MPATIPPNVANMPHDVADFTVSIMLAPTVDDDRAAQLGGVLNEAAALWLVSHATELREAIIEYAGLDDDEGNALSVKLGPRPLIAATEDRLNAEATEPGTRS